MEWIQSVRFKLLFGFFLVIAPLVFFLIYNNYYAMHIVREQVAKNYSNLLNQYADNMDKMLNETSLYLYQLREDSDIVSLYTTGFGSDQYVLTKLRIYSYKLSTGIGYSPVVSSMFTYSKEHDDLVIASAVDAARQVAVIRSQLPDFIEHPSGDWRLIRTADGYGAAKIVPILPGYFVGAWIPIDKFAAALQKWNVGEGGGAYLIDASDAALTPLPWESGPKDVIANAAAGLKDQYASVETPGKDGNYLLVKSASALMGLNYVLVVPEKTILRNLPYFHKALDWILVVVGLALLLYLLLFQRVFIRPLTDLIRAMRRLAQGKLDVRLGSRSRGEFGFLNSTFNDMAGQIEHLKINVYEEQLRVQQAEFRHLQVQINPHFYMNCLNIVYNLAALKDYKSVQKMALHLADYFRFIIQTRKPDIELAEELKHITNYLEIQRMRFPENLTYEIDMPDEFRPFRIPPLIVQPFVENAVIHGFRKRGEPFRVVISAAEDPDAPGRFLRIRIRDSGAGFPEEMLRRFADERFLRNPTDDHVGVWNVLRRLYLQYGDDASVDFRNDEEGAAVTLKLPIRRLQEGEN